jgi:hypothetical protein
MRDIGDFAASYQNHQKAIAEANVINKGVVFDALGAAEIMTVNVTFDGEGDSGQIENITADDAAELPQVPVELQRAAWGSGKLDSIQTTLRDAIETLCYDFLSQEQGGWENNDGAYGEFTFHVAERRVELDFNARFTDTAHSSHSF